MSRIHFAAAIAAVSVSLAACADSPTAPAADLAQPNARAVVAAETTLDLRLVRADGEAMTYTDVTFTSYTGSRPTVKTIGDNEPGDLDSREGYFRVKIARSQKYQARVVYASSALYLGDAVASVSSSKTLVDLGTITLKRNPAMQINQWEAGLLLLPVGGGSFTIHKGGKQVMTVTDNVGVEDYNNLAGKLSFVLPAGIGTYTVCEGTAPTGFKPLVPQCFDVSVSQWGGMVVKDLYRVR